MKKTAAAAAGSRMEDLVVDAVQNLDLYLACFQKSVFHLDHALLHVRLHAHFDRQNDRILDSACVLGLSERNLYL